MIYIIFGWLLLAPSISSFAFIFRQSVKKIVEQISSHL